MMQQSNKPVSKVRVVLMWVLMIGTIVGVSGALIWRNHRGETAAPNDGVPDFFRSVVFLIIGGFGLVVGIAAYVVTIASDCFTFNFRHPVWPALRGKIFLANTFVPIIPGLGLGFIVSAFLSPVLATTGLSGSLPSILPVIGIVILLQIIQLWVMIWAPLERKIIAKRLQALGITREQLQTGTLVGLSDPNAGYIKRMGTIESDVGALWVGPDQLVFWGDGEQFAISRDQLVQMERKADARSNTMLGGIAHVILHVQLPGGAQRQIRLHTEGVWTMGKKRVAMDSLADRITAWHGAAAAAPVGYVA